MPGHVSVPGFAGGTVGENERDESGIITDQDQTAPGSDQLASDDKMGAISESLEPLEDEPADFMRGEIDVLEQMDRAADAMDSSIRGLNTQGYEDSPRGELGAAFKDTPGGIEEVEMKTDEDLARAHAKHHGMQKPVNHSSGNQKH